MEYVCVNCVYCEKFILWKYDIVGQSVRRMYLMFIKIFKKCFLENELE